MTLNIGATSLPTSHGGILSAPSTVETGSVPSALKGTCSDMTEQARYDQRRMKKKEKKKKHFVGNIWNFDSVRVGSFDHPHRPQSKKRGGGGK